MIRRLLLLTTLGMLLSGCFMAPMALIGPATSGFTTASIIQSGVTTGANYMLKKSTGKTMSEHAFSVISEDILKQSYLPKETIKPFRFTLLLIVRRVRSPPFTAFRRQRTFFINASLVDCNVYDFVIKCGLTV